jgi:predicted deacylase
VIDQDTAGRSREIGRFGQAAAGAPTLLVVAGLHGNEPAGVHAAHRVLGRLARDGTPLAGEIVALAGNLQALMRHKRYIDRDLNRAWTPEHLAWIRAAMAPAAGDAHAALSGSPTDQPPMDGPRSEQARVNGPPAKQPLTDGLPTDPMLVAEDFELAELAAAIDAVLAAATGPVYVIDMHTTSSVSAPFALFADTLPNRAFALSFPLPLVLGLEEQIDGAMMSFLADRGCVCLGVEGGQHDAPAAVDNLEAVFWVALVSAGLLDPLALPDLDIMRRLLEQAQGDSPRLLEIRYRHAIAPDDEFHMAPGFTNFQTVAAGQRLAHDRRGVVRARREGRILMPLYQGQGDDGFFMTRAVSPRWLDVSTVLRRWNAGRLMRYLPGIRQHPTRPDTLIVNTRVARLFPLQIFHLLGFRMRRWENEALVVSRRRHDAGEEA